MLAKYSAYLALVIVVIVESSSALVYLMINTLMTFRLALSVSMILRVYIMHSRSLRVLGTLLGLSFAGIIVACVCLNSGIATQKKMYLIFFGSGLSREVPNRINHQRYHLFAVHMGFICLIKSQSFPH